MKKKRSNRIGFSIADFILIALLVSCALSFLFRTPIRDFLGEDKKVNIEYTFVIENVTDAAKNRPALNEQMTEAESRKTIGEIFEIREQSVVYTNESEGEIEIFTLTCRAKAKALETGAGFGIDTVSLKPGAEITVQTDSARFRMTIISTKLIETEETAK